MTRKSLITAAGALLLLCGCNSSDSNNAAPSNLAPGPTPSTSTGPAPSATPRPTSTPAPTPRPSATPAPTPAPTPTPTNISLCTKLNFSGVSWSQGLTLQARKSIALNLSITGSFEGRESWTTIANNSDGQGMSLGLLQQNFGQETLQPLLVEMFNAHPDVMDTTFASSDLDLMAKMLEAWGGNTIPIPDADLFPDSIHNKYEVGGDTAPMLDATSVTWAKTHLYTDGGTTFKTRWKTEFQTLAQTPSYKSLQIEASEVMFEKAHAYFQAFSFTQLRMMALMFDFVVQNGGFTSTHKSNYDSWLKANPSATETQKAQKLLEIRLVSVKTQYQADVRARKTAIINGTGTVHGAARNLPKEYCYTPTEVVTF